MYTFTIKRTYETVIEIEASSQEEAIKKLSETDVYYIEQEQCCVIDEEVFDDQEHRVKDINFIY